MFLPSLNTLNCWNTLRVFSTRIGKNLKNWAISSQALRKLDEGSQTRRSSLRNYSMMKLPRMGWALLIVMLFTASAVEANMVSFRHDSEIFNPVVSRVSVNMMDNFVWSQVSTKMLFNNESMFHNTIPDIFKRMSIGISHNIASVSGYKSWMEFVDELESVFTGDSSDITISKTDYITCFFCGHAGISHSLENVNRNVFMVSVSPCDTKFSHIIINEFFGNTVLEGYPNHASEFGVVVNELFFSDEKFSFHIDSMSPYFLLSREKVSRYSRGLQEIARRKDKEPFDNITEIKKQGDKVYIRTIADVTVFDHQKGMTLPKQRPESPDVEMLIDKGKGWNILLDDVDKVQSDIDLLNKFTDDAAKQINISVDASVLGTVYADADSDNCGSTAGLITNAYDLGSSGSPIQVTATNIIDYIVMCGGVLDEQNVPDEDRWMVIPSWMAVLLKSSDLKDASMTGDPKSVIRSGLLGMIDRFVIYQSNSVGNTTDSTGFKSYYVLFGSKDAISFANQFTKTESLRSSDSFDTIVRGLMVYGYKTIKPEALGYMYARK